jgi:hypothetical protein
MRLDDELDNPCGITRVEQRFRGLAGPAPSLDGQYAAIVAAASILVKHLLVPLAGTGYCLSVTALLELPGNRRWSRKR